MQLVRESLFLKHGGAKAAEMGGRGDAGSVDDQAVVELPQAMGALCVCVCSPGVLAPCYARGRQLTRKEAGGKTERGMCVQ